MKKDSLEVWIMAGSTSEVTHSFSNVFIKRLEKKLNLQLNLKIISWNRALQALIQGLKSDAPPDVFQIGSTWVSSFAYMGYLAEVPSSFPSYKPLAAWIEDTCHYYNTKIAVPWLVESYMLLAQRRHLDRFGVKPEDISTTDGFLNVCNKLYISYTKDPEYQNILPFSFSMRHDFGILHVLLSWFRSFGWDFKDSNHPFDFSADRALIKDACEYLKELFRVSHLSRDIAAMHPYELNKEFYIEGKFTFGNGHWWKPVMELYAQEHQANQESTMLEILPMPAGPLGNSPWGGGSMLCVSAKSALQGQAWAVVSELISDSYLDNRCRYGGDLPAIRTDFWDRYNDNIQVQRIYSQLQKASPYPTNPLWMPYERIFSESFMYLIWDFIYENKDFNMLYDSILLNADKRIQNINSLVWS